MYRHSRLQCFYIRSCINAFWVLDEGTVPVSIWCLDCWPYPFCFLLLSCRDLFYSSASSCTIDASWALRFDIRASSELLFFFVRLGFPFILLVLVKKVVEQRISCGFASGH
jgi:hypothetical protein